MKRTVEKHKTALPKRERGQAGSTPAGTRLSQRGAKGKNNGLYNEAEWRGAK